MNIRSIKDFSDKQHLIFVASTKAQLKEIGFSKSEMDYVNSKWEKDSNNNIAVNQYNRWIFVLSFKKSDSALLLEAARKAGSKINDKLNAEKATGVNIVGDSDFSLAIAEGVILSNYQFLKYFKDADKKENSLKEVAIVGASKKAITELESVTSGVLKARDLINEPLSYLTAEQLAADVKSMSKEAGFKVEVLNKKKIESLKMGGLLAVNKGSIDPPTFSILEWKPEKAKNKHPIVLVGKGVVYDTGGLSLKPTKNSMDFMKSDMSGAAAVAGAIYAIAKAKLNVHVIGLIPATDNRPSGNAYAPGDVIKMYNGLTVEVLNTDAEGRMLLADALAYAQKYKPELVIDLATLTGAAAAAIGEYGIVAMGNLEGVKWQKLEQSGNNVYERLVRFPFWDEYGDLMKSKIADLKNIGGPYAGSITAGKFLENFTDYPWIHLDIAGPAFLHSKTSYKGQGGTGVGVRLLFDFIKNN